MRTGVEVRHLRGWLHQILRHAAVQASKRAPVPAELGHADVVTPSAQQAAEVRMLTAEALAALAQLPARQHEAMVATAIHGQSRAEVAQLLGLTEGAVRQLVHRAREALRTAVTAITPYPLAQTLAAGSPGGGIAEVVAGTGAGSVGALALKIGALVASGVVATGIVTSSMNGGHPTHRSHENVTAEAATASHPPRHDGTGTRIADLSGGGSADSRLTGEESGRGRGGGPGSSSGDGRSGGSGTKSDGSSGGPSPSSGSGDGGGSGSGSPGGPSATTATTASSSDGGSGSGSGGSGSSDGGTTTTMTTSGSDGSGSGGSTSNSGGSGSSDGGTTTTTTTTTTTLDGGTGSGSMTSGGH
jgi:hypothetical protein